MESYVTKTRDKPAALRFLKKALKRHGQAEVIVTDGLRSYPAAMRDLGNLDRREMGRHLNIRAEFTPAISATRAGDAALKSLQKFAAVHASLHHPSTRNAISSIARFSRFAALAEWQSLVG